ncbi:MAG: UbiA family prenyltransferase [Thaumarchaeota archaeon]|nr:UbiA family prenyltransferase [Nitrososphaerota archaeon]
MTSQGNVTAASLRSRVFAEVIYGGHMPALDTSAFTFTTSLLLGFFPTVDLLVAAYLFTYGSYTLNRKREAELDAVSNPERTKYILGRAKYLNLIIGLCYLGSLLIAFNRNLLFLAALFAPLILSYFYNIGSKKFVGVMGASRLKEKFLIKNIAVSAGWALIPFLVLLYFGAGVSPAVPVVFIFIFLRVFINTVFCDIRDVDSDRAANIRTIPLMVGIRKTKLLLLGVNTFSGLLVFASTLGGLLPPMAYVVNLVTLYGYYYLLRSFKPNVNMKYLCDFVAEGEELFGVLLAVTGLMLT